MKQQVRLLRRLPDGAIVAAEVEQLGWFEDATNDGLRGELRWDWVPG